MKTQRKTRLGFIIILAALMLATLGVLMFGSLGKANEQSVEAAAVVYTDEYIIRNAPGSGYVLEIGTTPVNYLTAALLMTALESNIALGDVVHLTFDGTSSIPVSGAFTFSSTLAKCDIYIDGYIHSSSRHTIINNSSSTLYVIDGEISSSSVGAIVNNETGKIVVDGGTVSNSGVNGITIENGATGIVEVNSGNVETSGSPPAISNSGTLHLNGGTCVSSRIAVVDNSGSLTIAGGEVNASLNAVGVLNKGSLTMTSGVISAEGGTAINNAVTGTVIIQQEASKTTTIISENNLASGGTIVANSTAEEQLKIEDGNIVSDCASGIAINCLGTGGVNILGGNISATSGNAIDITAATTVAIRGGKVEATTGKGINVTAGIVNISGGRVEATPGTAIVNSVGIVNISGGTISSTNGTALMATSTGTITVSSGTISSPNGTCINNSNGGKIVIKREGITSPTIVSAGLASTITMSGNNSQISIEGGTVSNNRPTGDASALYLTAGTVNISGGTIQANIYRTISAIGGTVNVSGGTISATTGIAIYAYINCSLTIDQAVGAQTLITSANPDINNGTIIAASNSTNIINGKIENTSTGPAIHVSMATSVITISGGTINSTSGQTISIANTAATVSISGGTFTATTGVVFDGGGITNITGGTFKSTSNCALRRNAAGTTNISGGNFTSGSGMTIYAVGVGSVINISGGTISSTSGTAVGCSNGAVNISGGTISSSTGAAIYSYNSGIVTIKQEQGRETIIRSENPSSSSGTILVTGTGLEQLIIEGGTIENTSIGRAIYVSNTRVIISGGTVSALNNIAIAAAADVFLTISGTATITSTNTLSFGTIAFIGASGTNRFTYLGGTITNTAETGNRVLVSGVTGSMLNVYFAELINVSTAIASISGTYKADGYTIRYEIMDIGENTYDNLDIYKYQWYKVVEGGIDKLIEGATESTLNLKSVSESGKYYAIITSEAFGLSQADTYITDPISVSITKAQGTGTIVIENWKKGSTPNTPITNSPSNVEPLAKYEYKLTKKDDSTYTSEVPTKPGNYTVRVTYPSTTNYTEFTATTEFKITGLKGGAIAAIVICSIIFVALAGFAVYWFVILKKTFADLITAIKGLFTKKPTAETNSQN